MKNKKRRVFPFILLIIFLSVGGLCVWLYFNFQQRKKIDEGATFIVPRIKGTVVTVSGFTKEKTTLELKFMVDNPAPVGVTVDSMTYIVFIGEKEVMRDSYSKSNTLKANDSSLIAFPLVVNNKRLEKQLKELRNKGIDSVEYRVNFNFYTQIPFMKGKAIPYVYSKYAPLYMIPETELSKIKIEKAGIKNAKLLLTLKMINPNVFPYKFKNSRYKFQLDDEQVAEGVFKQLVVIPSKGENEFIVPVELKTVKAVQKGAKCAACSVDDFEDSTLVQLSLVYRKNRRLIVHESNDINEIKGMAQKIAEDLQLRIRDSATDRRSPRWLS